MLNKALDNEYKVGTLYQKAVLRQESEVNSISPLRYSSNIYHKAEWGG